MGRGVHSLAKTLVQFTMVIFLFELHDIAVADDPREHALFSAIRRGDLALLESHLREGAPANMRTSDGTTPLMLAALFGSPLMMEALLEHGADANAVNQHGATALLFAVGDLRKVELLVDRGANVNARSALGNTPLIAAAAVADNLGVIKRLLDRGADLHARNENDVSALAAAVYASDDDCVRFFLDQGCVPQDIRNLFGAAGNSLLAVAAQTADIRMIDLLLEHEVEVNAPDVNFAGHALNYALLSQKPEVARRLIEAGADLKLGSPVGKVPPLVLASYSETGDLSVMKLMIERGADVQSANQAGETSLTWARRRGFPDVIAHLAGSGVPDPHDARPNLPNREFNSGAEERRALIENAVEKSISLMQRSSDVFLENRRACVSCHHQNLQGVALGWARDRGFAVDESSIHRMIERQQETWSRRVDAAYEMDRPMPVPPQLMGYGLWGLSALGYSADTLTDAFVWYLAAIQMPDGHWITSGITRPPMGGSDLMSTVLAMRALQLYTLEGRREELQSRVEKARHWLAEQAPLLHQDLVYKLLGLGWAGTPPHELQSDLTRLRGRQRGDGGWAQLPHLESDAWATGQSLVAMHIAGRVPNTDPAFARAIDYLLRTQFDDGSWYVKSRAWPFQPPFDSAFPFGKDQWISNGATAWATMGLLLSIAPAGSPTVPSWTDPPSDVHSAGNDTAAAPATAAKPPPRRAERRTEPVDFARDIKPVLERSCAGCHSGEVPKGGFVVTDRAGLLRGGESGEAAVIAGRSGASPLFARASSDDPDLAMPPQKDREKFPALSEDEITAFRAWIDEGAVWPDGVSVEVKTY